MQQNIPPFILTQKQKQILMESDTDDVFVSIFITIISYKNIFRKVRLLIQLSVTPLIFQSTIP